MGVYLSSLEDCQYQMNVTHKESISLNYRLHTLTRFKGVASRGEGEGCSALNITAIVGEGNTVNVKEQNVLQFQITLVS